MKLPPAMPEKVRLEKPWKLSGYGLSSLRIEEGCVLHVYGDEGKKPTIGVGHLLSKEEIASGRFKNGITMEEAEDLLRADLAWVERAVHQYVTVPLAQGEYDALVSIVFNIGTGHFATSTLRKALNMGEYDVARREFAHWRMVDGKVSDVLVKRRAKEVADLWGPPDEPDEGPGTAG